MRLVLVADDTLVLREYVRVELETAGYAVKTAADGRDALRLAIERHDLVAMILDCRMPELSGVEVLEQLALVRRRLPVVVVSSDADYRDLALRSGARAFVQKTPGTFGRELLEALARVLGTEA